MSARSIWIPAAMALTVLSRAASASTFFPSTVGSTLGVPAPLCPLCHTTDLGVKGSATKPFALTLIGYGLTPDDTSTLRSILERMKDTGSDDSDGDGMGDIAELQQGRDPNVNDVTGLPPDGYPPPSFGCAVGARPTSQLAPTRGFWLAHTAWATIAAVCFRLATTRRRRLRSPARRGGTPKST
jgi:hypothetical protein